MVFLRVVRVAGRRTACEVARWLRRAARTRWLTKQAPSPWSVNTAPNPYVGYSHIPSVCAIRTATYLTVKYPRRYDVRGAGGLPPISEDRRLASARGTDQHSDAALISL